MKRFGQRIDRVSDSGTVRVSAARYCASSGEERGGRHTLTFLLEGQLALFIVILVLSTTPVLSSLSLVLRHVGAALSPLAWR